MVRWTVWQPSGKRLGRRNQWLLIFLLIAVILGVSTLIARAAVDLLYFEALQESSRILLRWGTASEIGNAGFYVNRSLQRDSGYTRLNPNLIPSQGDGVSEQQYVFPDTDVEIGVTYYYVLEIVNTSGYSTFTDPLMVTFGVIYTPTSTHTRTRTSTPSTSTVTATSTPAGNTTTPTNTLPVSLTPTVSPQARTPTRTQTATLRIPTNTLPATPTLRITLTPLFTQTPADTTTPTWTATFVPLPKLTLLFPLLSPTSTVTRTATSISMAVSITMSEPAGDDLPDPDLKILGGIILLIWIVLAGFLIVYLRRLGY